MNLVAFKYIDKHKRLKHMFFVRAHIPKHSHTQIGSEHGEQQ